MSLGNVVLWTSPGPRLWTSKSKVQPCPKCHCFESTNCDYLEYTDWNEDYACTHPEYDGYCIGCSEIICSVCKSK